MTKKGILEGIRIIDASTLLAAPLSTSLLGDFGAEVIKIEHPKAGDPLREIYGNTWKVTNRNKKTISLDLSKSESREVFYDLVKESDVVVLNYRPNTVKKWKIDYENLVKVKENIIMMHFTAYGKNGPYAEKPGFARVAESFAGLTYRTGYADRKPVFSGYPIVDSFGGIYGAFSLSLAILHLLKTGEGQEIDLALYEPVMRLMEDYIIDYNLEGSIKEREGTANPNIAPNDMYETKDGKLVVLPISTPPMFKRFMEAIGHPELIDNPRFKNNHVRVQNRQELDEYINNFMKNNTLREVEHILDKHNVVYGKVNTAKDLFNDPHIKERNNLISVYDDQLKKNVTMQGIVPKFSKTPGEVKWPGKGKAEDNESIYKQLLGYSPEKIKMMKANGII